MRVIAGKLGGRELGAVPAGVRPTSDRVRESLFSMLGTLEGKRVLDLFAGTGALGLESYSRGASSVVFVEESKRIAKALKARLASLKLGPETEKLQLMPMSAEKALRILSQRSERAFDLVLMDPPYEAGDRVGTLEILFAARLLSDDAVVVVEGPKRHPVPPVIGGRVLQQRRYGDTILTWLEATSRIEAR